MVRSTTGFSAADIRQGAVGDCWFLSAVAVVAERPDLISRLIPTATIPDSGKLAARLFVDGRWQVVTVDNHFPVKEKKRKGKVADAASAHGSAVLPGAAAPEK